MPPSHTEAASICHVFQAGLRHYHNYDGHIALKNKKTALRCAELRIRKEAAPFFDTASSINDMKRFFMLLMHLLRQLQS